MNEVHLATKEWDRQCYLDLSTKSRSDQVITLCGLTSDRYNLESNMMWYHPDSENPRAKEVERRKPYICGTCVLCYFADCAIEAYE